MRSPFVRAGHTRLKVSAIDLPFEVREVFANNLTAFNLNKRMPGHVDIPRLREGKVGGFFWYISASLLAACFSDNRMSSKVCVRTVPQPSGGGARFSECYMESQVSQDCHPSFLGLTHNEDRDTLEQIDVTRLLVEEYSDVGLFTTLHLHSLTLDRPSTSPRTPTKPSTRSRRARYQASSASKGTFSSSHTSRFPTKRRYP